MAFSHRLCYSDFRKDVAQLKQQILAYIDAHEAEMLQLWKQLTLIESPSHHKAGVDAMGAVIADFCQNVLGYHIRFLEDDTYGNCLAACSCPFEAYKNGIALSAHMDTVHPLGSFDPLFKEDGEYFYGPGVGDCKGGIILCLLTAAALKHAGYHDRPIKLLFAGDEESGGPTGRAFYPMELAGSCCMFNAESGIRGKLVTGRKSSLIATYEITGQPAHIGYLTDKPKSAIREAAMKLLALEDASDYDNLTFCGSVMETGSIATSVPGHCTLKVNIRIKDHSVVDKAIQILEKEAATTYVPGTTCTLQIYGNPEPMSQRSDNLDLCRRFSEASQSLGFDAFAPAFVGGASDASHASAMGIPVVCATGPVVDFQHTLNERVLISSMAQRAKIHAVTILGLSQEK